MECPFVVLIFAIIHGYLKIVRFVRCAYSFYVYYHPSIVIRSHSKYVSEPLCCISCTFKHNCVSQSESCSDVLISYLVRDVDANNTEKCGKSR